MTKSKRNLLSETSSAGPLTASSSPKYPLILGKCWRLIRTLNPRVGSIMAGFKCNRFVWEMTIKNLQRREGERLLRISRTNSMQCKQRKVRR